MVVALLHGHFTVDGPPHRLQVHHRDHRLEQGRAYPATDAGAVAVVQRDEDADREVKAGREVAHRDADACRLGVREAGHAHQAAHALRDLVDAAPLGVGTVLAEAA